MGCWSLLRTAGLDNSGSVIRLHLLGPTAIIGTGPAGGGRMNLGQPRMERVEGEDFCGPSQDGPGPRWGKLWEIDVTVMTYSPVGRLRCFTSTLYKGSVNGKSRVVLMMKFPTHATMNTYATSARFCAYADRSCNTAVPTARRRLLAASSCP